MPTLTNLKPFYKDVQTIYDEDQLTDFLGLFLDRTMLYSCAFFEHEDMTLEEAQLAKLDLSLRKCELRPGQLMLDIGCGWGASARRAAENYGVNVIGLTLSNNQRQYCLDRLEDLPPGSGRVEIRLQGWEEFCEPVDRIISIAAFEHFRVERHGAFFRHCRQLLPDDGKMLLHTIVWPDLSELDRKGIRYELEHLSFLKFLCKEIFPGGQLCRPAQIIGHAQAAGFAVSRTQSLQLHYARTLEQWLANLEAAREQAISLKSQEVYDRYMKYLSGCARYFRSGHTDVMQFSLSAGQSH